MALQVPAGLEQLVPGEVHVLVVDDDCRSQRCDAIPHKKPHQSQRDGGELGHGHYTTLTVPNSTRVRLVPDP
ncbi:hypothetical protein GCM10009608_13080 [Pseudonocardia alaniniphila]